MAFNPSTYLPLFPQPPLIPLICTSLSSLTFLPMKLINIDPKRLFRRSKKKHRPAESRSEPSSFISGKLSFSSSLEGGVVRPRTPTSVLPGVSGDWSDVSGDIKCELPQAFRLIDRDNDGIVSKEELEALLIRLGALSQEEVAMMLSEVDHDGRGCISVEALMNQVGSACGPVCDPVELREAFEVFDSDQDGKISAQELLRVFTAIGDERCTLEECRRMIARVDRQGDGFVCFEDFARMMELQW